MSPLFDQGLLCHKLVYHASQARLQELRIDREQLLHDLQSGRRPAPGYIRSAAHKRDESAVAHRGSRSQGAHVHVLADGRQARLHRDDHERRDAQGDPERSCAQCVQEELHQRLAAVSQSEHGQIPIGRGQFHPIVCCL